MNSLTLEQISAGALELPRPLRAALVEKLADSLESGSDALSPAWVEAALRRRDEIRSGKVQAIPGEEALARVRQSLDRRK